MWLEQQAGNKLDFDSLKVSVEFVFKVEGCCTLRVQGPLSGQAAQKAAALAAALVNLKKREQALDAAVHAAREQLPGVLHPKFLEKFDRLRGVGRTDAALAMLSFGPLQAICSQVAPEVWKGLEEEMVAKAIAVQSSCLQPPKSSASSDAINSNGSSRDSAFKLPSDFDLPTELVSQPEWEGWLCRLRSEVITWQRRQVGRTPAPTQTALEQGSVQQLELEQALGGGSPVAAQAVATAEPHGVRTGGSSSGAVSAAFCTLCNTAGGLDMRQELTIRVQLPEGRRLLQAVERSGLAGLASEGWQLALSDFGLQAAAATPEPQLQHVLEVEAFGSVQLAPETLSFTCTFHSPQDAVDGQQGTAAAAGTSGNGMSGSTSSSSSEDGSASATGGAASAGSSSSSGSGSSDSSSSGGGFEFGGGAMDLWVVITALSWMVADSIDGSSAAEGQWCPADGRIRFQRCDAGGGQGWPWRRQRSAGEAGESRYRLLVWPQQGSAEATASEAVLDPAGEPQEAELSQRQLDALMDCLDAFMALHPGLVPLSPLPPLQPPPGLAQRLASWAGGLLER